MSEPEPAAPVWRTGTIWGVLALLLLVGTVGLATCVYGLLGLLAGRWVDGVVLGFGAIVALLAFLFVAGVLYRVDRYRGAVGRRVAWFE